MNSEHLQGDYALLRSDSLRLLIPQTSLIGIVHLQNRTASQADCVTNAAQFADAAEAGGDSETNLPTSKFAALSEDLSLLPHVPNDRFVMTSHNQTLGVNWCWSEVQLLNNLEATCELLPNIVKTSITPIRGIVTLADGHHAFACQFRALLDYLKHH